MTDTEVNRNDANNDYKLILKLAQEHKDIEEKYFSVLRNLIDVTYSFNLKYEPFGISYDVETGKLSLPNGTL